MEITLVTSTDGLIDEVGVVEQTQPPTNGDVLQLTKEDGVLNFRVISPLELEVEGGKEVTAPPSPNRIRYLVERLE
jgi:hypothetical protein